MPSLWRNEHPLSENRTERTLALSLSGVEKAFGPTQVLDAVSIDASEGEFLSLFGPNGCGKTTLVNIIAGITQPDEGSVQFLARENDSTRMVGIVFQDYDKSLLPWRTCLDNIALPLEVEEGSRNDNRSNVRALLGELEIDLPLKRFPYQMSGGQKQLACIARALVTSPRLLLLDEPFASLDYQTRLLMHETIQRICQRTGVTTVFISHEVDEAILLADRLALLSSRPAHVASIFEVDLERPRTEEVFSDGEFVRIKTEVLKAFRSEVFG